MVGSDLKTALENAFRLKIRKMRPVGGGDIARAYLLDTARGPVFAKLLEKDEGLDMLMAEKEGLIAISQTNTLSVPEVLGCERTESGSCLLLEYIPAAAESRSSSEDLGRGLARMHQVAGPSFGWHQPNYIGRLPQENSETRDWASFYVNRRLVPQYEMARSGRLLSPAEIPDTALMASRVSCFVADVRPSLLHGDLWGGNYLISTHGTPYLIDPATYYGHSEVDLAMSLLFGGFSKAFYAAYFEIVPKQPGFELRVKLYQLYYLLVHLNLFGRSYYSSVRTLSSELFD